MIVKRERIRYTAEQKQAVIARVMPPQNEANIVAFIDLYFIFISRVLRE